MIRTHSSRSLIHIITSILVIIVMLLAAFPAQADGEPPPEPTASETSEPAADGAGAENQDEGASTPDTSASVDAPEVPETEAPPADPAQTEPSSDAETATPETGQADGVGTGSIDESTPAPEQQEPAGAVEPPPSSDPYFTLAGTTFRFAGGATYCADNHPGDLNCTDGLANPVQAAIDDLATRGTPDDGTVYVEDGSYAQSTVINGSAWSTTPSSLTLQSENGSGVTTLLAVTVQNMFDFILRGFTLTNGFNASGNNGTLELDDVVASNTSGSGLSIAAQNGEVLLQDVQANGNAANGASIDNTAGSGDVTVSDSQFSDNNTSAGSGHQAGLEVHSNGTVSLENVEASSNLDGDGVSIAAQSVEINGGRFNSNSSPAADYGNGIAAESSGGPITVSGAEAQGNEESGALLWYSSDDPANDIYLSFNRLRDNSAFGVWAQPESGTVTLKCNNLGANALGATMIPVGETVIHLGCPDKDDGESAPEFVGVLLSETESKIVNATNGVLVTFPPIKIIDPAQLAIGKVWPLKEHKLPGPIAPEDTFLAGVGVEMINAEFLEGSENEQLLIEFFIPGYLVGREFSVLWWDPEAEAWVVVPHEFEAHARLPGGKIVAHWPQTGTFVLVLHPEGPK